VEALHCTNTLTDVGGPQYFECVEIFVAMWQRFFNIWTDSCQMTTTSVGYINLTLFILSSHNWLANCDLTSLYGQFKTAELSKPDVLPLVEAHGFIYRKAVFHVRDFRLPPQYIWVLHSFGMLRSVNWQLVTDVSGQTINPICKGQAVHSFSLEDGTDNLSRHVGKYLLAQVA